jgi:hypothetical protein
MVLGNRFAAIVIAAALIAPAATIANARPQNDHDRKVYDSEHKDYHNWNKDEDQQWHVYLGTEHQKYHDFDKANKKQQADYWKWRHDHENGGHDEHPH